jgi:hypothetical protein
VTTNVADDWPNGTWVCEGVAGWRRLRSLDGGSDVSGSCRCRDVAVTRGAMGSHDYLEGGGLSAYEVSSPRCGLAGQLHQQLDRGVLDKAIPRRGDWVSR